MYDRERERRIVVYYKSVKNTDNETGLKIDHLCTLTRYRRIEKPVVNCSLSGYEHRKDRKRLTTKTTHELLRGRVKSRSRESRSPS